MDKLIKDIELIVSNNLNYDLFEDNSAAQRMALDLSLALCEYKARMLRVSHRDGFAISSSQWRLLDELVGYASDFWKMLPHQCSASYSYNDYHRMGFINAVLRMMNILGIDEKRVKK